MRKKSKAAFTLVAFALAAFLLLSGLFFLTVRTTMFGHAIRLRIVAAIERASGGRVDLQSFDFDWHTLTAQLKHLVIHGNEPTNAPPLLQIASLRIQFKITSLLHPQIDLASVIAEEPKAYLLVRPDGTNNIPAPHLGTRNALDKLFDLQVKHFRLNYGVLLVNHKQYPLDLDVRNLRALAIYVPGSRAYRLGLFSSPFSVESRCCRSIPLSLKAQIVVRQSRVDVENVVVASNSSRFEGQGTLSHFAEPEVDLHFHSAIETSEAANVMRLAVMPSGRIDLIGAIHFDQKNGLSVNGKLEGQHLSYRLPRFDARNVDVVSQFHFAKHAFTLNDVTAALLGGRFNGTASLDPVGAFHLDGHLSVIDIRQLAAAAAIKTMPYSASASGPLTISTNVYPTLKHFSLRTSLTIAPRSGGVPLSGNLALSENSPFDLEFGNSHLATSDTQLFFHGPYGKTLAIEFYSTNLGQLSSLRKFLKVNSSLTDLPKLLHSGFARLSGTLTGKFAHPTFVGSATLSRFLAYGHNWKELQWRGSLTPQLLTADSLKIDGDDLHVSAVGQAGLQNGQRTWQLSASSPVIFKAEFHGVNLPALFPDCFDKGVAAGSFGFNGSFDRPAGRLHIKIENPGAYGEEAREIEADADLAENRLQLKDGSLTASHGGRITFSGLYSRASNSNWRSGHLFIQAESTRIALSNFNLHSPFATDLEGEAQFDLKGAVNLESGAVHPLDVEGHFDVVNFATGALNLGAVSAQLSTRNQTLQVELKGDLHESNFGGKAAVSLTPGLPVKGQLRFKRLSIAALDALFRSAEKQSLPAQGLLDGGIDFEGPLARPGQWNARIQADRLKIAALVSPTVLSDQTADIELHNSSPIVLDLADGQANIRSFELRGKDTRVSFAGSAGYLPGRPVHVSVNGSLNLRILRLFDRDLHSSGHSRLKATIGGTLAVPNLEGKLTFQNASFALADFPNGLRDVNGSVALSGDRATIEDLTATTGGGLLHIGGFVTFSGENPLVYHLEARADKVRLSYASISATGSANLRLSGTSASSVLSGIVTVSRVVFNPNTDVGNVLSSFAAPVATPANQNLFLGGLHLDVDIQSGPSLQLSTSLSHDVEADIALRLRGNPNRPVLLGSISANQGDIRVFGTRYTINRGEVTFVNSTKIDPVLDLDLQTQTRGITVDITLSGALNQLNISYRSDPPLQPRDIIALLTVGRTPQEASNVQNTQVGTDTTTVAPGASGVIGQAMSAPSGRLSKLFGVTNIRLDPLVQGISNTTQSRLTLEQQISSAITVTYVTNLEETSEQIFRFEWAMSRQYSLVAVRDDNGEFGIDIQYKKRFK